MGGDSRSDGCGFEYQYQILDGPFSHIYAAKTIMFVGRDENKQNYRQADSEPFPNPISLLLLLLVVSVTRFGQILFTLAKLKSRRQFCKC